MQDRLLPCPFTGHKMFCAGQNILCKPKNLTAFSASSKTFVIAQKPILLNANHLFSGTKYLWLPQYANKFLVWYEKFGLVQNILGPVKGQGIRAQSNTVVLKNYKRTPKLSDFFDKNSSAILTSKEDKSSHSC